MRRTLDSIESLTNADERICLAVAKSKSNAGAGLVGGRISMWSVVGWMVGKFLRSPTRENRFSAGTDQVSGRRQKRVGPRRQPLAPEILMTQVAE